MIYVNQCDNYSYVIVTSLHKNEFLNIKSPSLSNHVHLTYISYYIKVLILSERLIRIAQLVDTIRERKERQQSIIHRRRRAAPTPTTSTSTSSFSAQEYIDENHQQDKGGEQNQVQTTMEVVRENNMLQNDLIEVSVTKVETNINIQRYVYEFVCSFAEEAFLTIDINCTSVHNHNLTLFSLSIT